MLNDSFHINWLIARFSLIHSKLMRTIGQLSDEQINWRPNPSSNSIANLVVHMRGNIQAKVEEGILNKPVHRDRELEFSEMYQTKAELEYIVSSSFDFLIQTIGKLTEEDLNMKQTVKSGQMTHLEVLLQCATHYSEHMGQTVYIAKQFLGDRYTSK